MRKTNGSKMDSGCLLWHTWPQHGRPLRLKHSAPKRMPFISLFDHLKNLFLYRTIASKCMHSVTGMFQHANQVLETECRWKKWMPFNKDFLVLSFEAHISVETWCPQSPYLSCHRCCQHCFFSLLDILVMPPKWMPLWKMFLKPVFFSSKNAGKSLKWMSFVSKMLSTLNPFCLTYCHWNRQWWWQMFSMSTPCLFVQVLEKTLWTFKTLFGRAETLILYGMFASLVKPKPPRNELVPCFLLDEEKTVWNIFKLGFSSPDFFIQLWLYFPTLQNLWEIWKLFWSTF